MSETTHEPRIIGFLCNWCSYRAADLAGISRRRYAHNIRTVRVMCSGRIEPSFVLKAFEKGADGVLIAGCHPGECHYIDQNHKTMRRHAMIQHTLEPLGIERARVQLVWASAAEGERFAAAVDSMVAELRELGPLNWSENWTEPVDRLLSDALIEAEHAEAMEVQP